MKVYVAECRIRSIILLGCFAVVLPACNGRAKHNERLQKEWNARCKEAADLLAGINDVPSAKAAEPKLKQALEQLAKINEKLDESYDPENVAGGEAKPMTEAVGQGIAEMQRLMTESLRISKIDGLPAALGETWNMLPASALLKAGGGGPPRLK